jgi:hypothetical protein
MKSRISLLHTACLGMMLAALSFVLAGCKTTPEVDWNNRVGHYTYDQAVAELGPPDKKAALSDGRTVTDWISHRAGGSGFSIGTGVIGGHTVVGASPSVSSGYSDKVLRLTFGPDKNLLTWSKNY